MSTVIVNPAADNRQRVKPEEMLRTMGTLDPHREAAKRGQNLSAYLEEQDPSSNYQDGLDAFSRLLAVADIRTASDPGAGYYASEFSAFDADKNTRSLAPEWMSRRWRAASVGNGRMPQTRAPYLSTDQAIGSVMLPYANADLPRAPQIAPAVPISEVVAMTTPIQGDTYRAFYLTDVTAQERLVRVAQAAELPRAKLTGGDQVIKLYKYGRALEVSYEILRRMRIDMVALYISRLAVQSQVDKLATIIDVAVNGDGNSNAATNYNLTALDSGTTANNLTLKAWLTFKAKFRNPYSLTAALAQEATTISLQTLSTGNANIPLVTIQAASNFGSFRPINPELADNVALGLTNDAPSAVVVGLDTRFAIERVYEIGADISEMDRWINRQVEVLTLSEVEGYSKFDALAVKTLTLSA